MQIAILGPGAIGGAVAAHLASDARHAVTLLARTPLASLVVETPEGELAPPVSVVLERETDRLASTDFDWVLVATKAYDVAGAARWLRAITPRARVAVLQNGVEHVARFADHVARDRIVPVVVDLSASRSAPGRILQRSGARLTVPAGAAGEAFRALFAQTKVGVDLSDHFTTAAWRKLCLNAAGAVPALLGKPNEIVRRDGIGAIVHAVVTECVAVGRAEGAKLDDAIVEQVITRLRDSAPHSINSLTADRIAGHPMEIDARNGVIVRLGARHGIATPTNAMLVTLLEALVPE